MLSEYRARGRTRARDGDRGRTPVQLLVHLRRAKDLADRRHFDPLDLDQLAGAAGVSKYHFLRCFTDTYGKTPARYLTERRVERAQDLLRATNLTVTEVCMVVGYSSLGSFSARFKELVGMTPSGYQERWAARRCTAHSRVLRLHAWSQRSPAQLRNPGEVARGRHALA